MQVKTLLGQTDEQKCSTISQTLLRIGYICAQREQAKTIVTTKVDDSPPYGPL